MYKISNKLTANLKYQKWNIFSSFTGNKQQTIENIICQHCIQHFSGSVKPRPHQQQYRSNIVECYKSNDFYDKVECCVDIVAKTGNIVAETGNNVARDGKNVEAAFNFVEKTKFVR